MIGPLFRRRRSIGIAAVAVLLAVGAVPAVGQPEYNTAKPPRHILLIRHAEKPPADDGSVHLSPDGIKRAEALYRLFEPAADRPNPFPAPDFVFAAKDSKHSHRSVETVTPLAKRLKLQIDSTYANEEFAGLAREVLHNPRYAGKTVLIAWHHGMAAQLAAKLGAADTPGWKGAVFDRVWQFTYEMDGKATLRDRTQHLMPGDAER
jgi:hypothetical protein